MKHPIGFYTQAPDPEPKAAAGATSAPSEQAEVTAVPSVVRVFFSDLHRAYSYYNDRFDLHNGDLVYVTGKLAGLRGRVTEVDYNFHIRLADYQRVIGVADTAVHGTFYALGAYVLTLEQNALPFRQVHSWFFPPEADGEYATGHGPGPVYPLDAPAQQVIPSGVAEKGRSYYMENRVAYLSVDGTAGYAIVLGTEPYALTFDYTDGAVSALTCSCYETGLCKHGAAVLLQLREMLETIRRHWPEAFAGSGYFAAANKETFSLFTGSGATPASITLA